MTQTQVFSLFPVDHLPEPILSSIFVIVCRSGNWISLRQACVPYILASVSRHWRTIALSTSRLWDFVDLSLRSEHLATHLARSKNLPIEVDLVLGENSNADVRESLRILGEKHNWTRIAHLDIALGLERPRVSGPVVDALNSAINANPGGIFRTISIHFLGRRDDMDAGPGERYLRIPQSQTLRSISLWYVGLAPIPSSSLLLGLERFELESVNVGLAESLFPLLDLTPNITRLSLDDSHLRPRPNFGALAPRPRHSILLPKLDTLRLHRTGGVTGLNMTFQTLNMPNLRYLSLIAYTSPRWADIDWDAICHCCALQCLELTGLSSEALMGLLSHIDILAQLRSIMLFPGQPSVPDEFARQLACRLLETSYCPTLINLSLFFPLDSKSMEIIEALRGARSSLTIDLEPDESDYEEDDTEDEGGTWEAENAGDQAGDDPN